MYRGKSIKVFTLLVVLVSLVFPATAQAATQGTGLGQTPDYPSIEIIDTTDASIDLVVRFPANPILPANNEGVIFNEEHYSHPAEVGVLDLPVLRQDIEIPAGEGVEVQILDSRSYLAALGEDGLPAEIPARAPEVEKSGPAIGPGSINPALISQVDGIFPESPAILVNAYVIRGHNIAQLEFWPVQYNTTDNTVEIYEELVLRINITETGYRTSSTSSAAYTSQAFNELLALSVLNYNQQVSTQSSRSTGGEGYLIISPDAFLSTLSPLVSLKESQGFSVTVAGLSTTGASADSIKAYIQNAYHGWPVPPTYVLLIGDVNNGDNSMPAFVGNSSQTVTDLYYGTVDGTDWIPDVFVGRLPARTTAQLSTMINNLIAYNGLTGAEAWIKKAAFLASNDSTYWQTAEATQNYVIQNHTAPAGYSGTFPSSPQAGGDKLYAQTYSAGNAHVINAINNHRALVSYTGHGSRTTWGGPYYSQSNIRSISSTGTFSVVTSFACITGDFELTESFGETWLLQNNKGAVAFIGSSSNSFWGPDDVMERAMMDSLYSGTNSANIVSSFWYAGLMAVHASRPGTGTAQSRYYWESYNVLGDPSLEMLIGPKASDFTLSVEPGTVSVCQGAEVTATVGVGQINGFSNPVTLSVTGLPAGVNGTLSINPVTPPNISQLTLSTSGATPAGTHALSVSGVNGGLYHETNLALSVFAGSPEDVTPEYPANGAEGVPIDSTLTWQETPNSQTYEIQIARDRIFSQIVLSQSNLSQPSFTPPSQLENSTTYYWRVRAVNPCGTAEFSPAFQFKTVAAPGECPEGTALTQVYQTDFESAVTGWTHTGTNDTWTRSTNRSHSPSYAFYSVDLAKTSLQHLVSPTLSIPETFGQPVTLKFWQWFQIEANVSSCYDGAILEISTNGGQSWTQIPDSLLLTSSYAGTISTNYGNPLGGSRAWCGSRDWSETYVDLTGYAGRDVKLRFTQGTDANVGLEGWYIDDFSLMACEYKPPYQPHLSTRNISTGQAPGQQVTFHLKLTNAGLNPDTFSVNISEAGWVVNLMTKAEIDLEPGEVTTLEIVMVVPADAKFGDIQQILLTVTSKTDPDAKDEATIELMAAMLNFIPIVSKP